MSESKYYLETGEEEALKEVIRLREQLKALRVENAQLTHQLVERERQLKELMDLTDELGAQCGK